MRIGAEAKKKEKRVLSMLQSLSQLTSKEESGPKN